MADPRVVVVGAGPAGVRAAQALVEAGLRPIVVDESPTSGGQIYRRQPALFRRSYETLYGFEAGRAKALHDSFDGLAAQVDYRPDTLAWNVYDGALHTIRDGVAAKLAFGLNYRAHVHLTPNDIDCAWIHAIPFHAPRPAEEFYKLAQGSFSPVSKKEEVLSCEAVTANS